MRAHFLGASLLLFLFQVTVETVRAESNVADTATAANHWGYGYQDLLKDLEGWKKHTGVKVDSVGASVEGRAIWMLTLSNDDTTPKPRVFVHARTHPAEVQALRICNSAIDFLLDTNSNAIRLRKSYTFNFIPMYNPDGVEKGLARQNAHGIDLESNWTAPSPEPEVLVLRATFKNLMKTSSPIQVALNLHSDQFNCTRFFFYHDSAGTSPHYTDLEKTFISDVQTHFPGGIESWYFVKSWQDGTGLRYPEGFWWSNYGDKVLALTYEDANCPNASAFDQTAKALLLGATDFIDRKGLPLRPRLAHQALRVSDQSHPWHSYSIQGREIEGHGFLYGIGSSRLTFP